MKIDKEKYLEDPRKCPFCRSMISESTAIAMADVWGIATSINTCGNCGKKWRDTYTITDVEEFIPGKMVPPGVKWLRSL